MVKIAVIAQIDLMAGDAPWPQQPGNLRNRPCRIRKVFKAGVRNNHIQRRIGQRGRGNVHWIEIPDAPQQFTRQPGGVRVGAFQQRRRHK